MRTKKEINDKWVLGEDYLNTNVLIGDETNE